MNNPTLVTLIGLTILGHTASGWAMYEDEEERKSEVFVSSSVQTDPEIVETPLRRGLVESEGEVALPQPEVRADIQADSPVPQASASRNRRRAVGYGAIGAVGATCIVLTKLDVIPANPLAFLAEVLVSFSAKFWLPRITATLAPIGRNMADGCMRGLTSCADGTRRGTRNGIQSVKAAFTQCCRSRPAKVLLQRRNSDVEMVPVSRLQPVPPVQLPVSEYSAEVAPSPSYYLVEGTEIMRDLEMQSPAD